MGDAGSHPRKVAVQRRDAGLVGRAAAAGDLPVVNRRQTPLSLWTSATDITLVQNWHQELLERVPIP